MSDISAILHDGEGETVEFKERWNDSALEAVAAFANTRGGTVLVGVTDKGEIIGWPGTDKDLQAVASQVVDSLSLHPSLTMAVTSDKRVLVVDVPKTSLPVAHRGRYYRRVGNTTREVPREEMVRFWSARTGLRWDSLTGEYSLDDINEATVRDFLRMAKKRLPAIRSDEATDIVLQKLQLLVDGKLTRGAILLFGKEPQRRFLTAQVHMGRFKGATTIIDDKLIQGNLFQQLNQVMQLFQQYLQVRFAFHQEVGDRTMLETLQREEIWEYPLEALREAVINALVHRDYFADAMDTQIRVYDDHIVLSNAGELPEGLTVESLRHQGHGSIPRNPLLAQVFYYAELVEKWGTGTTKMIDLCAAQGLPEPEFRSGPLWFEVVFTKDRYTEDRLRQMGLTERQMKAVLWVQKHGQISNKEYRQFYGVSESTATRELRNLVKQSIFSQTGNRGQGTVYRLVGMVHPSIPS